MPQCGAYRMALRPAAERYHEDVRGGTRSLLRLVGLLDEPCSTVRLPMAGATLMRGRLGAWEGRPYDGGWRLGMAHHHVSPPRVVTHFPLEASGHRLKTLRAGGSAVGTSRAPRIQVASPVFPLWCSAQRPTR